MKPRKAGYREFAHLLSNAYSHSQLFVYIMELKDEFRYKRHHGTNNYFCAGSFFNRVYGLELTERGEYNLGQFILTGKFKPTCLHSTVVTKCSYETYKDQFERYWRGI